MGGKYVFEEEELRAMSPHDRIRLLHTLAEIDGVRPAGRRASLPPRSARRRQIVLIVIVTCCIVLAIWTGFLAVTLPRYYRAGDWRGAWVGFDIALLAALAATGWAAWRGRQVLIICLIVLATLLLCDAWFDVVLDLRTSGFQLSLLTAVVIELPLAGVAIAGARRLLRLTIGMVTERQGQEARVPPLWRIPLFGDSPADNFRDLFPHIAHEPAREEDGKAAREERGKPAREERGKAIPELAERER
jgi:hypothetical protein